MDTQLIIETIVRERGIMTNEIIQAIIIIYGIHLAINTISYVVNLITYKN